MNNMRDELEMEAYQNGMIAEFKVVPLGRPAIFLLPSDKMGQLIGPQDEPCRNVVEQFLSDHYDGFTDQGNGHKGYYRSESGKEYNDRFQMYTVSFMGKDRIPLLQGFLAFLAKELEEESIYLSTGEDAWLVFPDNGDDDLG